ncbi:hypothetical protein I3760_05G173200 [Carya illinoinensis]|nr:hypothetical protein I3760_05G173200 [Carya illinoinensis]
MDEKPNSVTSPKSALGRLRRKLSSRKSTEKHCSLSGSDSEMMSKFCSELQWVFDYLDVNGDGKISPAELQGCVTRVGGGTVSNDMLKEAFAMYEMEGTDCITPTSLKRMLSRLGDSKSVEVCKAMIRKFDLNGDGVLSFEEFRIMMH